MRKTMILCPLLLYVSIVFFFAHAGCTHRPDGLSKALKDFHGSYAIHVSKKDFSLTVYDRELRPVASYPVGYGKNPDKQSKLYRGDNRTPEGLYHVTEMLSMDADKKSESCRKLKAMNSVYFRARDGHARYGHPDQDLGCNAYGPRFFRIDYPNARDRERYAGAVQRGKIKAQNGRYPGIGSGIAIHGNADEQSIGHLSSSGCVRMFNDNVIELERYIILGTPVLFTGN